MFYVLNIILIGLVLLIAYWWANQGLFSAILHLIAVIAAGAIALGAWEPLTTKLLLRGTPFDDYAWGVSLIGVFAVSLLAIRVAMDKCIRGNVDLPRWANLAFGFPVGLAAGILTIGIFVIGAGFIQSQQEIAGYVGWARSDRTAQVGRRESLWLPVNRITSEFYATLSVGSLRSGQPLKQYNPDLHVQACLVRDTFKNGQAKLSLQPDDATITQLLQCQDSSKYVVQVRFGSGAKDFGEQLTLSSAQIRLIGAASGSDKAEVVYPDHWSQATADGSGRFTFDDKSHYITSVPGQQSTDATIEFSTPTTFTPKFIQIRNTRYSLPTAVPTNCGDGTLRIASRVDPATLAAISSAPSIQSVIAVDRRVRPINASTNKLPAGIQVVDKMLSEGTGTFTKGEGGRISRGLRVNGFYAPKDTAVVQLTVTYGGPVKLYTGPIADRVSDSAKLALVDSNGTPYAPIGYMHIRSADEVDVKLDPQNLVQTIQQLPVLPTSDTQTLKLIFTITEGVDIVGLIWGEEALGSCNLTVQGRSR